MGSNSILYNTDFVKLRSVSGDLGRKGRLKACSSGSHDASKLPGMGGDHWPYAHASLHGSGRAQSFRVPSFTKCLTGKTCKTCTPIEGQRDARGTRFFRRRCSRMCFDPKVPANMLERERPTCASGLGQSMLWLHAYHEECKAAAQKFFSGTRKQDTAKIDNDDDYKSRERDLAR